MAGWSHRWATTFSSSPQHALQSVLPLFPKKFSRMHSRRQRPTDQRYQVMANMSAILHVATQQVWQVNSSAPRLPLRLSGQTHFYQHWTWLSSSASNRMLRVYFKSISRCLRRRLLPHHFYCWCYWYYGSFRPEDGDICPVINIPVSNSPHILSLVQSVSVSLRMPPSVSTATSCVQGVMGTFRGKRWRRNSGKVKHLPTYLVINILLKNCYFYTLTRDLR